EFLELQNVSTQVLNLGGIQVRGAVEFAFSTRKLVELAPRQHIVLVRNLEAFRSRYGDEPRVAGEYRGRLDNGGESLQLVDPLARTILEFSYDDAWVPTSDGLGRSLVIRDPFAPASSWNDAASWQASESILGSPGTSDESGGFQIAGDINQDGGLDLSDAISLLLELFGGRQPERPCGDEPNSPGNLFVYDVNVDARVDLSDSLHLVDYLFRNGPPPPGGTSCVFQPGCAEGCAP
ncbi:MAG: hypothetical protein AAF517_14245, partial [Planctomycetota bacterium]